jgi:hypothetical protein
MWPSSAPARLGQAMARTALGAGRQIVGARIEHPPRSWWLSARRSLLQRAGARTVNVIGSHGGGRRVRAVWDFEPSVKSQIGPHPHVSEGSRHGVASSNPPLCRRFRRQARLPRLSENRGVPGSSPGLAIRRSACSSATSRHRSLVFCLAATCHNVARSPKRSPKLQRRAGPYGPPRRRNSRTLRCPRTDRSSIERDAGTQVRRGSRSSSTCERRDGARIISPRFRRPGVLDPRERGSATAIPTASPVAWKAAVRRAHATTAAGRRLRRRMP